MPTIKEQVERIRQNQENDNELEKQIKNILIDHKDLIDTGLKHNLSAANPIDGYIIKITPQKQNSDDYNIYEIIIEEHFKTRDPLRYFKIIVKKEPIVTTAGESQFDIYCNIKENNQRLDHRQIIDFLTQTFGV
jgi:hypothetical protein